MLQRYAHSATAIALVPGLTEVTIFGGSPQFNPKNSDDDEPKIAETIVMTFGEFWINTSKNIQLTCSVPAKYLILIYIYMHIMMLFFFRIHRMCREVSGDILYKSMEISVCSQQ